MSLQSLQSVVARAKMDPSVFAALRAAPEAVIAGYGAMISATRGDALLRAGFHDGCQCTSCGCGGSIVSPEEFA